MLILMLCVIRSRDIFQWDSDGLVKKFVRNRGSERVLQW